MRRLSNALLLALAASPASAHSFYERYDLPIPLSYFLWGAALVVVLTFVLMLILPTTAPLLIDRREHTNACSPIILRLTKGLTLALFVLTIAAALFGTGNPLMNLAPSLVWVTWWVGFALLVACVGNVWPAIDPWRTLHDMLQAFLGKSAKQASCPKPIGMWPAAALMLLWGWLEVVYPIALVPFNLGCVIVLWTIVSLIGMRRFGADVWQARVDFFAIYFQVISKMGSQATSHKASSSHMRMMNGYVGFIMAMLSTVLFDGLHGNAAWDDIDAVLSRASFGQSYLAGTLGLVGVWLVFMASFYACTRQYASRFAPSLIPIAIAYVVAHNFSNLVVQGQNVIYLLSDPFGVGWNLLGTKDFKPNSDWLDAKFSWYLAVASIVLGHALAVRSAHHAALKIAHSRWQAARLTGPLTALMIAYTVLSLLIIAEPIVHAA